MTGINVRPLVRLLAVCVLLTLCMGSTVSAQTRVRVTSDRVSVWKPGFTVVATVVTTGDVLEVVRRQGNWYEVVVPSSPFQPRETGFIAVSRVELIDPASAPPGLSDPGVPPRTPSPSSATQSGSGSTNAPRSGVRGFGEVGYGWFTADQTFEAVLGTSGGPWYGGGAQYESTSGYFIGGAVEYFHGSGERVFVSDGVVYGLGISDTISIIPLMATGGVRLGGRGVTTYIGGGVGAYLFRETSDFADDSDNVKQTDAAYRALVGVQWPIARHYSVGFELNYTTVPDALSGGLSEAFNESNLGGLQLKARFAFGR